jgi:hypothetical protein
LNHTKQNYIFIHFLTVFVLLAVIAMLGSPYRYADGNNGRYLPNLYRLIDSSLFAKDPVAEAFTRFESVFYLGLGYLFRMLHVSVLQLESFFFVLWLLSDIMLLGLMYLLAKSLKLDLLGFTVLGAWVVHGKSIPVGGNSLFAPTLTHATIAVLLGIYAIIILLQGNRLIFWAILSGAIFVHSIIIIHLATIVFPVLLWHAKGRIARGELLGWLTFCAAILVYLRWMLPPAFNWEEAHLFLVAKGSMSHISPLNQPLTSWISMLGIICLAWLTYRRYLAENKLLSLLAGFMISGTLTAVSLGFAAIGTSILQLAQLQPLRMFDWVYFFAFVLLICAGVVVYHRDKSLGIVLFVVVLLNVLDSLWGAAWLYFGIACFLADRLRDRSSLVAAVSMDCLVHGGSGLLACASLTMWIIRDYHSFESFHDPTSVIVVIASMLLLWIPRRKTVLRWTMLVSLLFLTLVARSVYVHTYVEARQDQDYNDVCRWIALNTDIDAHFITAVFNDNGGNFRARAIRTTLNEEQSALYWVAPLVAEKNSENSKQVMTGWNNHFWDINILLQLARSWDADYLLIEGNYLPKLPVLYVQGRYRVIKVP